MSPKRKPPLDTSVGSLSKRRRLEDEKDDLDNDDSDPDYEPTAMSNGSESETTDSDAATSSEEDSSGGSGSSSSGEDKDDIDSTSASSSSSSDDEDQLGENLSDDEKKSTTLSAGREVGGRQLRNLPDADNKNEIDNLKLTDLAFEFMLLDAANTSTSLCHAACIKGRVFLAGDRILMNEKPAEIDGFSSGEANTFYIHVKWLIAGSELVGAGIRHGNYLRCFTSARIQYGSLTEIQHVRFETSTCKITHSCDKLNAPTYESTLSQVLTAFHQKTLVTMPVSNDKGRWRPALFGVDRRWNAGEQRRLLIFLRRVWPTCVRPSSVTIAMRPAPHKDNLAVPDDNVEDVRDIAELTVKYHSLWKAVVRRTDANAASCQRWLANTYDSWRRYYLTVQHTDWETAFREFTAVSQVILQSILPRVN